MIPGKPYNPRTRTSRRPTPEKFAHLRKWIDIDKKFLDIKSISDLQDIDVMLEQMGTLYLSNEISQVIAQLIGKYNDGFVTIEGTADGELKVKIAEGAAAIGSLAAGDESIGTVGLDAGSEPIGSLTEGDEDIGNVFIAGSSHTILNADITITGAGRTTVVAIVTGKQIKIVNMAFTADDEVNITLETHETAISGAMDFGATGEPKGMVHHFGNAPLCTVSGQAFNISTVGAGKVNGYVTYYTE